MVMILIILNYYFILLFITALFSALYYEGVDLSQIHPSKGPNVSGNSPRRLCLHAFLERLYRKGEQNHFKRCAGRKEGSLPNRLDQWSQTSDLLGPFMARYEAHSWSQEDKSRFQQRAQNLVLQIQQNFSSAARVPQGISRAAFDPESQTGVLPK